MLHRLIGEYDLDQLAVAHCNFQLRGAESDEDERWLQAHCASLGLRFYVERFDTTDFAKQEGVSIQMAARDLRYEWFEELMSSHGCLTLATAHHADDNVETFFINLLRGTGIAGLSGIPQLAQGYIWRPLLEMRRHEIVTYAKQHNITWREDSSNQKLDYLRNSIRHRVMPLLQELKDDAQEAILHTISHLDESEQALDSFHAELADNLVDQQPPHLLRIDIAGVDELAQPALFLHYVLASYGFDYKRLKVLLRSERTGARYQAGAYILTRDREKYLLDAVPTMVASDTLVTQERLLSDGVMGLSAVLVEAQGLKLVQPPHIAQVDAAKLNWPLSLRLWRQGDRMQPLGMQGEKLISDILIDDRVPLSLKSRVWVLCSDNEVVWLVGMRISERYKVSKDTQSVLKLSWQSTKG